LNEGVVDTEAIEFIASRNANAVESKHSLEQGCVLDAGGVGCYRPHELFDLDSVEEDNGVRRSLEVFPDWFMWWYVEAASPLADSPGRLDWAPNRVGGILPEGDYLSIVTVFLPAPADVNPKEGRWYPGGVFVKEVALAIEEQHVSIDEGPSLP
jgi:hypothetical protein